MLEDFRNEPFTDFSQAESRSAFESALARVDRQKGVEIPLVIGGRRLKTGRLLENRNPADRSEVLSRHHLADRKTAAKAVEVAVKAQKAWGVVAPRERASVLLRAAARMRARKHEFSATMVLEIGKSWPEADVETAEAIDFLEFYAREMLRWGGEIPVTPYRGEFPETLYVPLGAGAVIPPWNFPNAILTGMTSAAVVTGNAVVLKPASDTPLVAWKVFTLLEEAGVPAGVLNYLPGPGSEVGDLLVEHAQTRFISFTGSKEVGLDDQPEGGRGRERPALDQAHRPRDGRQGLHRRGRGRGLRLRGLAGRRLGVRVPGPEVLGLLAGDRPPAAVQALRGRRRREDREAHAGPDARPHELPRARSRPSASSRP